MKPLKLLLSNGKVLQNVSLKLIDAITMPDKHFSPTVGMEKPWVSIVLIA